MNSTGKGGVIASSVLMTATNFDSSKARSRRGRGRQMNLVDIHIWPQESRAAATIMRTNDKSRLTWHSTWSFNMESTNSPHGKSLLTSNLSDKTQHLQYKGFIGKEIANEFEVSLKNHFSIHQTLGRGTEGQVFRCITQKGAFSCAIKRCDVPRKQANEEPREARVLKMLRHPNVKKLYIAWKEEKAGTHYSSVYLAQELCKCSFDDYLDQKKYRDIDEKLEFFKEAVLGLNYLHQKGIIHRDIKAGNIFLDNLNKVKIGDFGSGAFMGSASCLGRDNRFWGTQFYASPELWNLHTHNEKTDVFSLGIFYFELFGDPTSSNGRYKRLEKLESILNSSEWKTNPLQTWLKCSISKGWSGKVPVLIRMLQTSPSLRPTCHDILLMLN